MSTSGDRYDFAAVEKKWREHWLEAEVYRWDPSAPRPESYVIDTPPPTVSGLLHIGHVYSYTQTDLIARYRRMSGRNVFYPMGFDDNGLPSERLVEKTRGIRAADMSREEFIRICHDVVQESEEDFRNLFREIALSVDWSTEYQTISPHCRRISQMSILDLFAKGHLYRKPQPTLWDPVDRTALAQAEVVDREQPGTLWDVAFDVAEGGEAVISTTRPELLAACVALFVHPEHPRAGELIGRQAVSPLFRVPVPILPDPRADPEKGTGIVMCCTFGDTTDIEWWQDHDLPTRVIVTREGRIGAEELAGLGGEGWPSLAPEEAQAASAALAGLKVAAARQRTVELLTEAGRIRGKTDVVRMVPCAERSGVPLEILVTPQWFVRALDKKEALIERGREIAWYPEFMRVRYEMWVQNLKWDWCISRQRYFGVPFPFWYSKRPGEEGRILVAHPDDLPVNPLVDLPRGYTADEVEPDVDVMDTWATSSVSPQINSHAISPEFAIDYERHRLLFPADLRPQAHEIIRTWAFYTILKAHLHEDTVPWHTIAISGWCLAEDRSKMSKSKGNVITPRSLLERYGADVVRYWTATSRLGLDTALSENVLKVGKRLVTKLWNAARFAGLQLQGFTEQPTTPAEDVAAGRITETFDLWVLSRLQKTVAAATAAYERYEYADALAEIERFFWRDFCDNYLELVKGRAYGEVGDAAAQRSARYTLWHGLEAVLRLFAPTLPYITEELYSTLFPARYRALGSIHARGNWPNPADQVLLPEPEALGEAGLAILAAVRKVKTQRGLSMKVPIRRLRIEPRPAAGALAGLDGGLRRDLGYTIGLQHWVDAEPGALSGDGLTVTEDDAFLLDLDLAEAGAPAQPASP